MNLSRDSLSGWKIDAAGVAVCLVLTAAGYLLTLHPLIRDHQAAAESRVQLAGLQDEARHLMVRRTELQKSLGRAEKALAECELKLLSPSATNGRINELAELAMELGLKIDGIQPGNREAAGTHEIVPIEIRAQGRFLECISLLRQLHRRYPDTGLAGLTLTATPSPDGGNAGITLNLAWYTSPGGEGEPALARGQLAGER